MNMDNYFNNLTNTIKHITKANFLGLYIHGSWAMGGFNPARSDLDILVVIKSPLDKETQCKLAKFLLDYSNEPYPIEISFLSQMQLRNWVHPCPYEFHYSEAWRQRFEEELSTGLLDAINESHEADPDIAAHITILNERGIRWEGPPIKEVFPVIPHADYLSSILADYRDCLENIEKDPIYCVLNLVRVYRYVKEGIISSKQEAGEYGLSSFPKEFKGTLLKVVESYHGKSVNDFQIEELKKVRNYIKGEMDKCEKEQLHEHKKYPKW